MARPRGDSDSPAKATRRGAGPGAVQEGAAAALGEGSCVFFRKLNFTMGPRLSPSCVALARDPRAFLWSTVGTPEPIFQMLKQMPSSPKSCHLGAVQWSHRDTEKGPETPGEPEPQGWAPPQLSGPGI